MPAPEELIETLDLNPPMLYINDEERRFMLLLAPILTRSPRSLKRFINVYRLIKVGMNDEQWNVYYKKEKPDGIGDWSFKNFEVVMFLLAVVTGMPNTSRMLYQNFRVRKQGLRTFEDVLKRINIVYKKDEDEWYIFEEPSANFPKTNVLHTKKKDEDLSSKVEHEIQGEKVNNIILYNMQMEFLNFIKWLMNWKDSQITREAWLSMDIDQLRYWDPFVSRYSFRVDPPILDES